MQIYNYFIFYLWEWEFYLNIRQDILFVKFYLLSYCLPIDFLWGIFFSCCFAPSKINSVLDVFIFSLLWSNHTLICCAHFLSVTMATVPFLVSTICFHVNLYFWEFLLALWKHIKDNTGSVHKPRMKIPIPIVQKKLSQR